MTLWDFAHHWPLGCGRLAEGNSCEVVVLPPSLQWRCVCLWPMVTLADLTCQGVDCQYFCECCKFLLLLKIVKNHNATRHTRQSIHTAFAHQYTRISSSSSLFLVVTQRCDKSHLCENSEGSLRKRKNAGASVATNHHGNSGMSSKSAKHNVTFVSFVRVFLTKKIYQAQTAITT